MAPIPRSACVRSAVVTGSLLLMTACEGFHAGYISAGGASAGTTHGIDHAYAERDTCLARNAAERTFVGASAHARAAALARTCAPETSRLILASRQTDPAVASAIRDDTEHRALAAVLRTAHEN